MANTVLDFLSDLNFESLLITLFDSQYYEILFPFLLLFSLFYTVGTKISIFQSKSSGHPVKPIIFIVSLVISLFGVSFEISNGYTVGKLLMVMFPNISALTIGILTLYLVGALLGKNFFKGLFKKGDSAFVTLAAGGIGLGAVVYYTGIAMGIWNYETSDIGSYWNFIIALFMLILGITFLFVDLVPFGILLLAIFGSFVGDGADGNILSYIIDPFIFFLAIIVFLFTWMMGDNERVGQLERRMRDQEDTIQTVESNYGRAPDPYESQLHDIASSSLEGNKKEYKKLTGKDWSSSSTNQE